MKAAIIFLFFLVNINLMESGDFVIVDTTHHISYKSLSCADSLNCMAIGSYKGLGQYIKQSTDGGITWFRNFLDTARFVIDDTGGIVDWYIPANKLNNIDYYSANQCLIACDTGRIMISNDAGNSWSIINTNINDNLYHIKMINDLTGIVTADQKLIKTTDGGISWFEIQLPNFKENYHIINIAAPDEKTYFLLVISYIKPCSSKFFIYRSDDAGKNWLQFNAPPGTNYIYFADSLLGWSCSNICTDTANTYRLQISQTKDGGKSWNIQVDTMGWLSNSFTDIEFYDRKNGLATATGHYWTTADGGNNWEFVCQVFPPGINVEYNDIEYPTLQNPILLSRTEYILRKRTNTVVNEDFNNEKENIYPNPAKDYLILENANDSQIILYDITGRRIPVKITKVNESGYKIDLTEIKAGLYFLTIYNERFTKTNPVFIIN